MTVSVSSPPSAEWTTTLTRPETATIKASLGFPVELAADKPGIS
jgi:hypothetical protein